MLKNSAVKENCFFLTVYFILMFDPNFSKMIYGQSLHSNTILCKFVGEEFTFLPKQSKFNLKMLANEIIHYEIIQLLLMLYFFKTQFSLPTFPACRLLLCVSLYFVWHWWRSMLREGLWQVE